MKKIFFFLLIILLFFNKTQNVFAKLDAFTVDNINIEGKTIDNNYREKYIEIGFRKAFQSLISNILKTEDQKKILSTDLSTIKSFVQNYRIIQEKINDKNYSLKLAVTFKGDLLNRFLSDQGISYSSSQKLETLIYPIFILNSELQVFSGNKFFEEWNDTNELSEINFILPLENLDDLNFIKEHVDDLEEIELSSLVDNYEIKNSAILILRYDKEILNVFIKTNFKNTKKLKKIEIAVKDLENKNVRNETITKLKFLVYDIWKEQNLIDILAPSYLTLYTKLSGPENLKKVLNQINQIDLIKSSYVQQLNKDEAKIKIKYLGKVKNLESLLKENGFILKIKDNEWNLTIDK